MRRQMKTTQILLAAAILIAALSAYYFYSQAPQQDENAPAGATGERAGPPNIYPDPERTPGVANPEITQGNIAETICNPEWSTRSIRPPVSYTGHLKRQQIREFRYEDTDPADYEEDHLIPLELGGHPSDPANLWPEAYTPPGAYEKDNVENYLHHEVCGGRIPLTEAQQRIAGDWYRVYQQAHLH